MKTIEIQVELVYIYHIEQIVRTNSAVQITYQNSLGNYSLRKGTTYP